MSLVSLMLETTFGIRERRPLAAGLFHGGAEVTVDGYERVRVPRWRLTSSAAQTQVVFGPFPSPVTFDRLVIFAGDEPVEEVMLPDTASYPRNMRIPWDVGVDFADPGVPWCHADMGEGKPLHLALKSGNFGGTDFFDKAFEVLR